MCQSIQSESKKYKSYKNYTSLAKISLFAIINLVFLPRYRAILILLLVILDILIARNIFLAKNAYTGIALGAHTSRTFKHAVVIKPSPTLAVTPTPSATPIPTQKPTSIPTQPPASQNTVQTSVQVAPSGGSLMDQLNAFRASKGLSAVQSDPNTCGFAATRAQEIASSFDHSGFENRVGSHTLPYPSYHEVTENIAMNSDSTQIIQMWIDSPTHNANMQKDTPYVCIMSSGSYYAYEGWRP